MTTSSIPLRKRIGVRILVALVAIAVFSVVLTASSHYLFSSAIMRSSVAQRNLQIARRAAGEINVYLDDAFLLVSAFGQVLGPVPDLWLKDLLLEQTEVLLGKFDSLHLVGESGVIASSALDNSSVEFLFPEYYDPTKRFLSEVWLTEDGLPVVTVIEPTRTAENRPASLVAEIRLRDIWRLVDDIAFGESGHGILVASDRRLIAHTDKALLLTDANAEYMPREMFDAGESSFTSHDDQGAATLVSVADIRALDWHLIVEQRLSEAYIPVYTTIISLGVVAALVLGAAAGASVLLARRYSIPLTRLLDGTNRIRTGNLSYRIEIDSEDEIGRLSRSFNSMVVDLEMRSRDLAQSEEKYRLLTENVNDIIFVCDADGRLVYINPRASSILGVSNRALIGSLYTEFLPSASIDDSTESEFTVEIDTEPGRLLTLEVKIVKTTDPSKSTLYYGVARDVTERMAADRRLREYQNQLRSLASELSLAEASERKKIASQIHDRIGQALALVRIKLGILGSEGLSSDGRETLKESTGLIEEIIQDTRSLIFSVSSPLLYEVGLSAALERLVEQFQQEHDASFVYGGNEEEISIDTDVSVLLFDSVRELMVNVVKHAHADRCEIDMRSSNGELILSVKDDGTGIDDRERVTPSPSDGGFGLFSIRERLESLGGKMDISSDPNDGTTVLLRVPKPRVLA